MRVICARLDGSHHGRPRSPATKCDGRCCGCAHTPRCTASAYVTFAACARPSQPRSSPRLRKAERSRGSSLTAERYAAIDALQDLGLDDRYEVQGDVTALAHKIGVAFEQRIFDQALLEKKMFAPRYLNGRVTE